MDLEISTSKPRASGPEYLHGNDAYGPLLPSSLPPPSLLLKKENEPWRGPSAFGMANILNRSHSVAPPPPSQPQPQAPLPKFSLPSLHSFGKPLITKQEPAMNRVRSILNDPPSSSMPMGSGSMSDGNVTSTSESSPLTTSQTPSEMNETPRKAAPSRRIAPAPTDDDEGGEEDAGPDSIRGGRWSSEEHDRFLAGFRIHGHKWKRVQQVVRTRSVTQVRTHAQKYLLKLAKLKGEKKPGGEAGQANSASDTESTHNNTQDEIDERSPRKKMRRFEPPSESVDEDYITAAASTLCFLMRQKIDSLFDSRMEDEKDLEPYDCYSNERTHNTRDDHSIESSRKRPFMHFITDNSNEYSYVDESTSSASGGSPNGYSIDGKQLCS